MGSQIIKVAPDVDLYVEWSSIVEAPTEWGDRQHMTVYLQEPVHGYEQTTIATPDAVERRLERADRTGSSGHPPFGCTWDDHGEIYMQRGVLPRAHLFELCARLATSDETGVAPDITDLLEPFDE